MKRNSLTFIYALTIISLFLVACRVKVNAKGSIIHVPEDYQTIQDAINHANIGDIIYVHKGTYHENIVIDKSVFLLGENRDLVIIDGNKTGNVITILTNNVTIMGFTIQNSGTGVQDCGVYIGLGSTGNIIANNKIINNYNGIGIFTASKNKISSNIISNNYEGIFVLSSIENVVFNNTISKNTDGLGLYFSNDNLVSGNTLSNNTKGMAVLSSVNNIIYHNNFVDNTVDVEVDSNNAWSYKGEGNYWSRYSGRDLNQDGVGDYPYIISENRTDDFPLMGSFFGFEITLNEKEYAVNIISNSSISNYTARVDETGSIILCFEATAEKPTSGFIRVTIPKELADNPLITLIDDREVEPKILDSSDVDYMHLYISYTWGRHIIKIVSSTVLGLYRELSTLNSSYQILLEEYSTLLANYSRLQSENEKLRSDLSILNSSYFNLLEKYNALQKNYTELDSDYRKHLLTYSENLQNIRNLAYVLMTSTAAFLVTTVYLSRQVYANLRKRKTKSIH